MNFNFLFLFKTTLSLRKDFARIKITNITSSLTNSFTSLLAGLIVFSTLGNIAKEQGQEIDDVVAQGTKLLFYYFILIQLLTIINFDIILLNKEDKMLSYL